MAKIKMLEVDLHSPLFMVGSNLGTKIKFEQRQAEAHYDTELSALIVQFKGKVALVPSSNIASMTAQKRSDLGIEDPAPAQETALPPVLAKARRGRPPQQESEVAQEFTGEETAEEHRARVRAASANAYKPAPLINQDDALIQASRMAAMGVKSHKITQVSNAQQVGAMTQVSSKPKAINHTQLKAQIAAETKETQ